MRGRLAAGRLAALVLGILITGIGFANRAGAFEWELPGERKFSIHGFYEARLLFTGEDLPANHATFSQFRHVLSLELELTLFPDGFGPFDSMFMFTRVLASYDCIYTRACGLFSAADSYGDTARRAVRQPASLKEDVKNQSPYFGGLMPMKYVPGTLADPREELNPGRRYRKCDNPPGVFQNPFGLAVFCNLNQRSPLDGPLKPGLVQLIQVRGGDFSRLARESLLNSARPGLGEEEFGRLRNLLIGGNTLSVTQDSLRRALIVEAAELEEKNRHDLAQLRLAEADAILGTPETTFDANIPELLGNRPDPNRFAIFARKAAPELLQAKWGSNKIGTLITPFLATIDTPIRPRGYFGTLTSLDWYGQYETGLADNVLGQVANAPFAVDSDGSVVFQDAVTVGKAVPFFLGPDGIRDTADDLPFVTNNQTARDAGYQLSAPLTGVEDRFDLVQGPGASGIPIPFFSSTAQIPVPNVNDPSELKTVELYGVWNPNFVKFNGCQVTASGGLGGVYNRATNTCTLNGQDVTDRAAALGCRVLSRRFETSRINIGVNGDGDCIEVNTSNGGGSNDRIQYEVINLLSDLRARPAAAASEPTDATDLRLFGDKEGFDIPARPRNSANGIVFESPGAARFYDTRKAVVSRLDLDFNEDELQWNHGASQKEHEFAEGYVEFEMADSQIFTKLGKLIVVWGKTELFRNQDRNNPLDIGNGLFSPLEEARVAQWAADVTISPEMFMRVGPVEDLRLELLWIFNRFEPTDLGKCGEGGAVDLICLKSFGAMANGLAGIGVAGERRPDKDYNGLATWDYGARIEGRLDRFTFAISDFWGWEDGFYLDLVNQYERTADFTTGAPLSVGSRVAGGKCAFRRNGAGAVVGPNGIAGDGDDIFASDGNCLLWGKPFNDPNDPTNPENGRQHLRAPDAIASLHTVNQTLFHSICSFTFDQDEGYCAFDRLNNPDTFGFISLILGGLGGLGSVVLDGTDTIRTEKLGYTQVGLDNAGFRAFQFQAVNPRANPSTLNNEMSQDLSANLQPEQAALLGCGPAYANPCSNKQAKAWDNDPAIRATLERIPGQGVPQVGGIDLMNADGGVVTQEFVGLKALSPGALVGTRNKLDGTQVYLPGINYDRDGTFVAAPDPINIGQSGAVEVGRYLDPNDPLYLTPQKVINMGRVGRARYQRENGIEADGWIEPMPWTVNREAKRKWGAIVFNTSPIDPEVINPDDLYTDDGDPDTMDDQEDGELRWNLIDKNGPVTLENIDGEYCSRWMNDSFENDTLTPFNQGCTVLEHASANFERLLISTEIIGFDRVFDPPESLAELSAWGGGSTAKQAAADPISGPDGIFTRNQMVFSDEEVDFQVMPFRRISDDFELVDAPADKAEARAFLEDFDPNLGCPTAQCLLDVTLTMGDPSDTKSTFPLVLDLPIGYTVDIINEPNDPTVPPGPPVVVGQTKINLAGLQITNLPALRRLFAGQVVEVNGGLVQMSKAQRQGLFTPPERGASTAVQRDLNGDAVEDLDQDHDGIWDGMDDYSAGPITDDNILCGSGIPGDVFQDAIQYEPYRLEDAPESSKFKATFPKGLPPRSPVFCRGVAGIVGGTTQTLPVRKAGGDGRFGRRDFLWQGGRQVAARYQKRNVLGFGLDFAEDVTKTSWGVEFSWTARRLLPNTLEYSGNSQSDDLVLSVSVDRPTFFNFLNPNRSFFLNYQMFVRYLPNYQGGSRNKDGMYGSAAGPWSTQMVLTFFTGYFQDRLAPRMSMVYWPQESQGAVLTGLSYRWNDAFSTSIGYSAFFGHVYDGQGAYFPIAQYGATQNYESAVLRGSAAVQNRDQAELRFRYTW